MRVILLGGNSFAGRGLAATLEQDGHECLNFSRGPVARRGDEITGALDDSFVRRPDWPDSADWIVNFIFLREESIEENQAYCRRVLELARQLGCRGVVQISSIMVYRFDRPLVSEDSTLETCYQGRPFYAAVKMATDLCLRESAGDMRVLFVRPGFILGSNHPNVMVGTAASTLGGWLLLLGNARQFFPLTSREKLAEVLRALLRQSDWPNGEAFLVVDHQSPTKGEFIRACMTELGQGRRLVSLGAWFWLPMGLLAEVTARLLGQRSPCIFSRLWTSFRGITYDCSATEAKLGLRMGVDWRKVLASSYDRQAPNYRRPEIREPPEQNLRDVPKVLIVGVGGIVRQKHLPALRRLGFRGTLDVHDPRPDALRDLPFPARRIDDVSESDATVAVIASPPACHTAALRRLPATAALVLAEKPLVLASAELEEWLTAEKHRRIDLFHNYRYKDNVLKMLGFLDRFNPGELLGVRVQLDTSAIQGNAAKWRRSERASRTLLYDAGIHSLDLAAAFAGDYEGLSDLRWKLDGLGNTAEICGGIRYANYPVHFQLRQGTGATRNHLVFDFANYNVRLTFNPDTFVVLMGLDMAANRFSEAFADCGFLARYLFCRLWGCDQDQSHVRVYRESLRSWREGTESSLSLANLAPTYRVLSDISRQVYGAP